MLETAMALMVRFALARGNRVNRSQTSTPHSKRESAVQHSPSQNDPSCRHA
jgi:hypothetical protein